MNKSFNILAFCCVVVVGGSLFQVKYQVIDLEKRLETIHARIAQTKESIKVLQAEWGYLNNPGRLQRLAQQHLNMTPPEQTPKASQQALRVIEAGLSKHLSQRNRP